MKGGGRINESDLTRLRNLVTGNDFDEFYKKFLLMYHNEIDKNNSNSVKLKYKSS
ncbi:MAG: hypothetical protein ACI9YE_000400 [Psychroserpens sp.]|jgi:hypothetical protein